MKSVESSNRIKKTQSCLQSRPFLQLGRFQWSSLSCTIAAYSTWGTVSDVLLHRSVHLRPHTLFSVSPSIWAEPKVRNVGISVNRPLGKCHCIATCRAEFLERLNNADTAKSHDTVKHLPQSIKLWKLKRRGAKLNKFCTELRILKVIIIKKMRDLNRLANQSQRVMHTMYKELF